jgi:hypothetical protein
MTVLMDVKNIVEHTFGYEGDEALVTEGEA